MDNAAKSNTGGIGIAWLLTIVFIVLKLVGVITWSWWWVFSPLWISAIVTIVLMALLGILVVLSERKKR
jgi:Flp pilus assembly protein TadB